jgi:hypothetical protein
LEAENENLIVKYNSWENDFYSDPLIAILYNILDQLEKSAISSEIKQGIKNGILAFRSLLTLIPNYEKFEKTITEVNNSLTRKAPKNVNKALFNEYTSYNQLLKKTRETLSEIVSNKKLIVLVDEIDRCLPEYSIKVMERLHHLFSGIPNLIVIIAVDKKQLDKVISDYYTHKDVDNYLQKFLDFEIKLEIGITESSLYLEQFDFIINQFKEDEIIKKEGLLEFIKVIFNETEIRARIKLMKKIELINKALAFSGKPMLLFIIQFLILFSKFNKVDILKSFDSLQNIKFNCDEGNGYIKSLTRVDGIKTGGNQQFINFNANVLGVSLRYLLDNKFDTQNVYFANQSFENLLISLKPDVNKFIEIIEIIC